MPVLIWTTWSLCNGWSLQHCSQIKQNLLAVVDCKIYLRESVFTRWKVRDWLCGYPLYRSSKRGKFWAMMIQDPSVELVPQKVRTKDSKWSWKNILHESVSMKNIGTKDLWSAWIEMDIGWHISDLLSFFTRSARSASLSFFTRSARSDSLTFFTRCAWWFCTMLSYSCWVLQELLYRIRCPQIRKVRICSSMCQQIVYRRNVEGKEKGNYNRSLTFLGKCKGETATTSSCLFILSLLNLHMLAGLYLQSL